jgi:hypothetical protein
MAFSITLETDGYMCGNSQQLQRIFCIEIEGGRGGNGLEMGLSTTNLAEIKFSMHLT